MTLSTTTNKASYSGDGTTATFNYAFKIFANSDLKVFIRDTNGTETLKTITTHYTVAGAGSNSGGSITFTAGNIPLNTDTVILQRVVPLTQTHDYVENDPFPAESHEQGLDRLTMHVQQIQEEVDRSIKASVSNTITSTEFGQSPTERANKLFGFDSAGDINVTTAIGTYRGNWSASTAYNERDIVKDTNTNNIFIANTAHTSSGNVPLTTNADSAKWDLLVDAESASISATASANSATASANSATASANSATASATSETNASTSETNASTSATASANSSTDSSEHATTASRWAKHTGGTVVDADTGVDSNEYSAKHYAQLSETHYDNFDDRYLGAKNVSSHPTANNDGDSLTEGTMYYNTNASLGTKMYVYTGSSWQEVSPTETATDVVPASSGGTFSGPITATSFTGDGSNLTGLATGLSLFSHISGTHARSTSNITFAVTVNSDGKYLIDGQRSGIEWTEGQTYIFDISDSSNSGHDFEIGTSAEGGHLTSGSDGYTKVGTDGSAGASVTMVFSGSTTSQLYYFCDAHAGMGSSLFEYGQTTNLTTNNQAFTDQWTGPFGFEKTWVHPSISLPFGQTVICGTGVNFYITESGVGFDKKTSPYVTADTTLSNNAVYPGKLEILNGSLTINSNKSAEVMDLGVSNMVIT